MRLSPAEKVMATACLADFLINIPLIALAALSGSASAMTETVRGVLLSNIDLLSLAVFLAVNRRRFSRFEFGLEKIQILVQIVIALAMCISIFFIAGKIWRTAFEDAAPPNYLFSLLFSFFAYINFTINFTMLRGMLRAHRAQPSVILRSQLKNRLVMTISSAVATLCCFAVVLPDDYLVILIDIAGALVVLAVICLTMVRLLGGGLLVLLDAPIAEPDKFRILRAVVERYEDWGTLRFLRTRRLGHRSYAEVGLSFDPGTSTARALAVCGEIEAAIAADLPNHFVAVYPVPEGEPQAGGPLIPRPA